MLPPDAPFLETALALLALPFRPVTAGVLLLPANAGSSDCAACQAHMNYPAAELRGIKRNFHLTPMQSIEEIF